MNINLEDAKAYLRVDLEHDDALIESLLLAAKQSVYDYLNRSYDDAEIPAPVRAAILMLTADIYELREVNSDVALYQNKTYFRLLNPYRLVEAL